MILPPRPLMVCNNQSQYMFTWQVPHKGEETTIYMQINRDDCLSVIYITIAESSASSAASLIACQQKLCTALPEYYNAFALPNLAVEMPHWLNKFAFLQYKLRIPFWTLLAQRSAQRLWLIFAHNSWDLIWSQITVATVGVSKSQFQLLNRWGHQKRVNIRKQNKTTLVMMWFLI